MAFKPDHAQVLEFSSALQFLKPDSEAMDLWLNTMAAGDYAFGYGLLRSADDAYDPFGVLVELNGGEWEWDDQDEAWAFAGSAAALKPRTLASWLGMSFEATWLDLFLDAVTRMTDASDSFTPVVETLRAALQASQTARSRLGDAYRLSQSMNARLDTNVSRDTALRRYDHKGFYGL